MPATAPIIMSIGLHLEQQRAHQQRGFHAFARDHQQREQEHAGKRGGAGLHRRRLQMSFDVSLDALRGAPHVHRQRGHRHGRGERENAFPQRLVGGAVEQPSRRRCSAAPRRRCPSGPRESAPTRWLLRRYARLMATIRKASSPSRRVMTNACNILRHLVWLDGWLKLRLGLVFNESLSKQSPTSQVGFRLRDTEAYCVKLTHSHEVKNRRFLAATLLLLRRLDGLRPAADLPDGTRTVPLYATVIDAQKRSGSRI